MTTATGHLTLAGDSRPGHVFYVQVEESSGGVATVHGETVTSPWLRARCSCGWEAADRDRFTIEENAHWLWLRHAGEDL